MILEFEAQAVVVHPVDPRLDRVRFLPKQDIANNLVHTMEHMQGHGRLCASQATSISDTAEHANMQRDTPLGWCHGEEKIRHIIVLATHVLWLRLLDDPETTGALVLVREFVR